MSIREVTYYQGVCDWPGEKPCDTELHHEYSAWVDAGLVQDEMGDADWHIGVDGKNYCDNHPTTWASDHEDGEPYPDPPYLVIHDGDTGNPDDDGRVSLIQGRAR